MPCDVWVHLAEKAKLHRGEYSYFAYNTMTGVSKTRKKTLLRDHQRDWVAAQNEADTHRYYCEVCKNDPPESFRAALL